MLTTTVLESEDGCSNDKALSSLVSEQQKASKNAEAKERCHIAAD